MIAMIGTSDRLCWLAETCKILLLLLWLDTLVAELKDGHHGCVQHAEWYYA